ncbi:sigma-54-dependent transcriptional regulator [Denitrobaculum tricleocarpae]|uniref:Sigma-54-dependent Fis family transcriptional regulator n=1 Tax=Denitrobaculum tricleocarpae TaxID=2591009 RepID=A0A545TPQ0_9PROT|nr:sigma-54 dependent transcriptional regulator [Denitrobaculum tricleocarpae]TQV79196.1 sigma-54-dependent Fis family transcriptional regulator [Denitrobaculum tricleocarpae]
MARDILIVDDEADIRLLITGILSDEGYETREASNSDEALEALRARRPNLVILDIWLDNSKLDGLQLLEVIKSEHPGVPVVMISGHGTIETAVKAITRGAYDFIEKPFKSDRLLLIIERAIEAAQLRSENEELKLRAGPQAELIGDSTAINQLRHAVTKVAPTGSRVLITGPAGAGKEVVARLIHDLSRRNSSPFVALNCAAMHPDRLEAELFGNEADAETSAGLKVGTFEQAHGGTLLLDEVADMPLETQGKIVRVLQEQSFERVGGNRTVEVDVRVVAATNRDLPQLISEGLFREDLYYRLNVVPLDVPALRDRREDIPGLVTHFMERASKATGLPSREVSNDALAALQAHEWPGNVRQLRNVIDWILIMAVGDPREVVRADMLPADISKVTPNSFAEDSESEIMALPLRDAREIFERKYLEAQVTRFGGNISRTASFVGMERSALHRKLRSLGITSSERQ